MRSATAWQVPLWVGLMAAGCMGEVSTRPGAGQLSQGLNILRAQADRGLEAAYVKADHVIYLETRVGPLKPAEMRQAEPDEPQYELDVRYLDALGNTFSVQRGGDRFIDPSWAADIARAQTRAAINKDGREADFLLAQEAAGALELAALPAAMAEHVVSAARQGRVIPSAYPELAVRAAQLSAQQRDITYTDWYWQEADVFKKPVALVGKHHAVLAWDYSNQSSSWYMNINTCNHGTCAASMGFVCFSNSGWQDHPLSSYFTGEGSGSTDSVSGGCLTPYDWWTGSGTHNSNDDAWYELWQVQNGQQGSPWSQAGYDNGGNYFACDCAAGCNDWVHTISCWPSH